MWNVVRPKEYGTVLTLFIVVWSIICILVCACSCWNILEHGPKTVEHVRDALEMGVMDEDSANSSSENDHDEIQ